MEARRGVRAGLHDRTPAKSQTRTTTGRTPARGPLRLPRARYLNADALMVDHGSASA